MTRPLVTDYFRLLDRYDAMIHTEPWFDGRRDEFVRLSMDPLLRRMTKAEKDVCEEYAEKLYNRRISA